MIRDLLPYPITTGVQVTGSEGPHIARLVTLQSNTGQRGSDLRQPGFILLKANGKPWANRQQMSMAWEWGRDHNPNL